MRLINKTTCFLIHLDSFLKNRSLSKLLEIPLQLKAVSVIGWIYLAGSFPIDQDWIATVPQNILLIQITISMMCVFKIGIAF